jgi:uncharacterized membrane protein
MKWSSLKPLMKGIIIGLVPLILTVAVGISVFIISISYNVEYMFLFIPIFFVAIASLIFLIFSILVGFIIGKKSKK